MRALCLLPLTLVAACDGGPGTTISFNSTTEDGKAVVAKANGEDGRFAIDAPGFKANIQLPKIKLDAGNMDIGGVKLFPGSTVAGMNIAAGSSAEGDGTVRIAFDAPGRVDAVRAWFGKEMERQGFSVQADGQGLSGTTDEGDPIALELKPGADGHTSGAVVIRNGQ